MPNLRTNETISMQRERTLSLTANRSAAASSDAAQPAKLPARAPSVDRPTLRGGRGEMLMTGTRSLASRSAAGVRRGRSRLGHLASDVGQGTVEYVGLLLLMATVLVAIVGAASTLGGDDKIGKKVVTQIGNSIDKAGGESR